MRAFLIPGAFEDLKSRNYKAVLKVYKEAGYEPKFVTIDWKYKTIDDWVAQVKAEISEDDLKNSLLSGFSWGSMIALAVVANYTNPKKLFLFSLSPYFAEDLPHTKKAWLRWSGKKRLAAFKQLYMNQLAAKIDCPTTIFIGDEEVSKYIDMKRRAQEAHRRIKNSRLIIVPKARHDPTGPNYLVAIRQSLAP